jgi:predicted HTH domain antitoxin
LPCSSRSLTSAMASALSRPESARMNDHAGVSPPSLSYASIVHRGSPHDLVFLTYNPRERCRQVGEGAHNDFCRGPVTGFRHMTTVTLQFPDDVFSALRRSPEEFGRELRVAAAILWYERGEISQEKAALVAGLSRTQFLLELARTKSDAFVVDFDDLRRELGLA